MNVICAECWDPIVDRADLLDHAERHQVGTDGIAVRACPRCNEKETGNSHPAHTGRCWMPTGRMGVVSCYCTYTETD
jgi:hypothetical protein